MSSHPTDKNTPPAQQADSAIPAKRTRDKTPERTDQQNVKDTPAVVRSAHSSNYWDGTLGEKRMAILRDLGYSIPEEGLDIFFKFLLPPLKGFNIDSIMSSLRADGTITQGGRWAKFPTDPSKGKSENDVFYGLEEMFDKVAKHARSQPTRAEPTCVLRLLPNRVPVSERDSTTKPDGYFVLKQADRSSSESDAVVYRWYDIALTCEFKLRDTVVARDDDVSKLVFSMQHTMTLDPCRRFTYGISIENTTVRLWFCSRAVMIVSEPFDFIKQPNLLVHVFLSLAFATRSELGWDPTIKVVHPETDKRVYQIEVNGKWYEVLDILSDFGADAIIGRATRVFRVKDLLTGKSCVLKDVWVEDDRELEHVIYEMILKDVESKFGEKARALVALHLLTPVNYALVEVDGREDHTMHVMMRGHTPSFGNTFLLKADELGNEDGIKSVGPMKSTDREVYDEMNTHLGSRLTPERQKKRLRHRRHYRIVFEEVAKPIWTLTSLSEAFVVLMDCAKALYYMHKSGWIHRDISAGNIYLFEQRGLLGDLEYAKKMGVDGTHQMRTGTADFMAVEVMMNDYLFLTALEKRRVIEETKAVLSKRGSVTSLPVNLSGLKFAHNEGHDVESLWWVAIYLLFFNGDIALVDEETPDQRSERREWMLKIFPSAFTGYRQVFFQNVGNFRKGTSWFPRSFAELVDPLRVLREALVTCYTDFEKALPHVDETAFDILHDQAIVLFEECANRSAGIEIQSYKVLGRRRQKQLSQREPPVAPTSPKVPYPDVQAAGKRRIVKDAPRAPENVLRLWRKPRRQA